MKEDPFEELKGTSLYEKLTEVRSLYEEVEEKEKKFTDVFHIHCRKNCGECCKHFEPDVTELEALYLAYGIIREGRAEEYLSREIGEDKGDCCPLYSEEKFCTEYEYRPLLCRLFNACASNDKYGNPAFRSCKWNDPRTEIRKEDFESHPEATITMEEFGQQLEEEEDYDTKTVLLLDAIKKAIGKILFLMEMEQNQ